MYTLAENKKYKEPNYSDLDDLAPNQAGNNDSRTTLEQRQLE